MEYWLRELNKRNDKTLKTCVFDNVKRYYSDYFYEIKVIIQMAIFLILNLKRVN